MFWPSSTILTCTGRLLHLSVLAVLADLDVWVHIGHCDVLAAPQGFEINNVNGDLENFSEKKCWKMDVGCVFAFRNEKLKREASI